MILVDTTVWIDWLRATPTPATGRLAALLDDGEAALAPVILQELLQGAASPRALLTLRRQFEALPMLMPRAGTATYAEAGTLYSRCRWQGVTPHRPLDA